MNAYAIAFITSIVAFVVILGIAITLAMPESLEYFEFELEKAIEYHKKLKDNPELRTHIYSLTYAKKAVNDLKKQLETAKVLWG